MNLRRIIYLILLGCTMMAACKPNEEAVTTGATEIAAQDTATNTVPAPTATQTATHTPTPTNTHTPTPTSTATPTQTPQPSRTPTATAVSAAALSSLVSQDDIGMPFIADSPEPDVESSRVLYIFNSIIDDAKFVAFVNVIPNEERRVYWESHIADLENQGEEFAFLFPETWTVGNTEFIPGADSIGDISQGVFYHFFDEDDTPVAIVYHLDFRRGSLAISLGYWEYGATEYSDLNFSTPTGNVTFGNFSIDLVELARAIDGRITGQD